MTHHEGLHVSLAEVVEGLPVQRLDEGTALEQIEVRGVEFDSRRVSAGDLFVAWPGEQFDGRRFAAMAVEKGAVGIVAKGEPADPVTAPWFDTEDPRRLLGALAARIYGRPDRDLVTVGVTGTNGKSTTVFLVAAVFEAAGMPCGTLGTLGYRFGTHDYGGERTTPEASDLFRILRSMHERGAMAASFEVSSHALDQGRVAEARFDVGVFTNLTRDHFDYHGDFETYFEAKRRLFDLLKADGGAVVWRDDGWGRRLLGELRAPERSSDRRVISYGESPAEAGTEAIEVQSAEIDHRGIRTTLRTPRGDLSIDSPLLGRYNLWNLMAAVGVAELLELPHEAVREGLHQRGAIDGRLDPVDAGQDFLALVDYAHTDGALRATLESVEELWSGRTAVVFGCGGNKDQGKRPLMGRAAAELSDWAIVTDDNPRDEAPEQIHAAVLEGMRDGRAEVEVIADRRAAIRCALERAVREPGWAVVIAGKGHESGQTVAGEVRPFVDREEVERALADLLGTAGTEQTESAEGEPDGSAEHA